MYLVPNNNQAQVKLRPSLLLLLARGCFSHWIASRMLKRIMSHVAITYVSDDPLAFRNRPPHSSHYICKSKTCILFFKKNNFFLTTGSRRALNRGQFTSKGIRMNFMSADNIITVKTVLDEQSRSTRLSHPMCFTSRFSTFLYAVDKAG